jgi:acetyl esterase/lipase
MVGHLAKAAGCRALFYRYAYAHEPEYPHRLDTALSVYSWLLEQRVQHAPMFLQVGGDETLLEDTRMFAERAKRAAVDVEVESFPGRLHSSK